MNLFPSSPSPSSVGLFLKIFVISDCKIPQANTPKIFFQSVFVTKQEFQPYLYSVKHRGDKLKKKKENIPFNTTMFSNSH